MAHPRQLWQDSTSTSASATAQSATTGPRLTQNQEGVSWKCPSSVEWKTKYIYDLKDAFSHLFPPLLHPSCLKSLHRLNLHVVLRMHCQQVYDIPSGLKKILSIWCNSADGRAVKNPILDALSQKKQQLENADKSWLYKELICKPAKKKNYEVWIGNVFLNWKFASSCQLPHAFVFLQKQSKYWHSELTEKSCLE